jgi:hypothetical protein
MHSIHLPSPDNALPTRQVEAVTATTIAKPFSDWPLWAKAISLLKSEADKGVGSTIERTIGPTHSTAFKLWYQSTFGKSCGCNARKQRWDKEFPYIR